MEEIIKRFDELSRDELFEIYKLRTNVFVVEQQSAYPEVDDADKVSIHVWFQDEEGIEAYARVVPAGAVFDTPSVGRVIAVKRRQGLGTRILSEAMRIAQEEFHAEELTIEAQVYARSLYEKAGFVQTSDPFLDAGIPHIQMKWHKKP